MRVSGALLVVTLALLAACQARSLNEKECEFSHQVWKTCGTDCEKNCENNGSESKICTERCNIGCFCQKPYIFRKGQSGPCVLPEECPKIYHEYITNTGRK
ncbi:chymotrypsin inhibitor-like [Mantella aurantiaca]